jgi:two-component system phosphate regulon sensor histidine kinase PhoR
MKKREIYDSIIENIPVGFSMVDREGNIIEFNRAAETITGYAKGEVIGRPHLDILHDRNEEACPLFKRVLKKKKKTIHAETVIKSKSGEHITGAVTSFPIYDEKGEFSGGVEIFRDMTEYKRRERERKNFLTMFVHDMKNAIIPVQGFLTRMLEGKAGPLTEKQHEYLDLMKAEMSKFEIFVIDFLEFSKFEAKKYKPDFKDFHIDDALRKNIETVKLEAEQKNIQIRCDSSLNDTVISADATMINRVIMNLLNNAVKYTKRGGTIQALCSMENGRVLVQIKNPGTTISEDQVPFVFDAFFRSGKDRDGSGLGLAISKKIIDMHNGSIRVDITRDRETVFSFALPVRQTK